MRTLCISNISCKTVNRSKGMIQPVKVQGLTIVYVHRGKENKIEKVEE